MARANGIWPTALPAGPTSTCRRPAVSAGRRIADAGIEPRYCFTSYLRRAIHTLQLALGEMRRDYLPVVKDWHLNERHYGALQGLDKADTAARYGDEQVHTWRRSYDVRPPALEPTDSRSPALQPMYAGLDPRSLPLTESLADTVARVRPCWEELMVPALRLYGTVLVAAHGNSLRALVMMLRGLSAEEVVSLEIPTGAPLVFELDDALKPLSHKYL